MEALQPTIFGPIQGIQLQTVLAMSGAVRFEIIVSWSSGFIMVYHGPSTGLAISAIYIYQSIMIDP